MSKATQLSSDEIHKQLKNLGINAYISGVLLEYQNVILDVIKLFMLRFPDFCTNGLIIREAKISELKPKGRQIKSWIAYAEPIHQNGKLMVVLRLNPIWFRSKALKQKLSQNQKTNFAVYSDVHGNICHELGHVLWYKILAMMLNIKIGEAVSVERYNEYMENIADLELVTSICLNACHQLSFPYSKQSFIAQLSRYAADNAAEAFAESVAEYCTSNNIRPLANEIIRQYFLNYNQYKKNTD